MEAWPVRVSVNRLRHFVIALPFVLLAGCSATGAPTDRTQARSPTPTPAVSSQVAAGGNYIESCRVKGVPIPPDWKSTASEWESHGHLSTILLTPNNLDQTPVNETSFASIWSYAPPQGRGACLAIGRSNGSFQIICQSATTGYACFWGNDPRLSGTSWTPHTPEVQIASLQDPVKGFAPDTAPCTECHRGNNAFLYAPDDPTWATVLRPAQPRPTFTTRVEQSAHQGQLTFGSVTVTYPRYIPIGGSAVDLTNPLPTGPSCSGSCHELHIEMFKKNYTVEGYIKPPRPMGPNCAANSPLDDPTKNCYQQ